MNASPKRRVTTIRLVRALWRYRGRLAEHGDEYQAEVATAVRTALDLRLAGRVTLRAYRFVMRLMWVVVFICVLLALLTAAIIGWTAGDWWWLLGVVFLGPAAVLGWFRLSWGAPLDWLDEHADPARTVALADLPPRLRELAAQSRTMVDVRGNIAQELDDLAGEVEQAGPHVVT